LSVFFVACLIPFCDRFYGEPALIIRDNDREGGGGVTVVYLDSVLALNTLMDYLLCLVTARLAGIPLRRKRYLAAALLGGLYAGAVFLPGCGFLSAWPVKLAAGVLMALAAYGGEAHLLRLTLLLLAVSCAMAGCVLALGLLAGSAVPMVNGIFYTDVDAKVLVISAAAAYLLLTVVFRGKARHGVRGQLLPVKVSIGGRTTALTALWDSGNSLRDPAGGRPVLVAAPGALDDILPVRLSPQQLRDPAELLEPVLRAAPALRPRLLPYHAVGASGLLLAVRTDWVEVNKERYPGAWAALSPTALGGGYTALWGGEMGKGEAHGNFKRPLASIAGLAGGTDPLHRRQRRPAAAADPGAGGGAAGASHGGGRPAGAD
jgi:stage II sporulation protein GA (sporulation sigma-E factor processing peptidase)